MAASQNHLNAQHKLGLIYYEGKHVRKDNKQAISYFVKSSNLGNKNSLLYLGIIYYEGKIVQKDIKKAISYFLKAAEKNCIISNFYLGVIFFRGKDYRRNMKLAIRYFKEASSFNYSYAKNNLGIIYKNGFGVERNIYESIIYFEEAIKLKNDQLARYNLAHIYFFSNEVQKDIEKSIRLLITPSLISFDLGLQLLCLIIIDKLQCNELNVDRIDEEIIKYNPNSNRNMASKIYNKIISLDLIDYNEFQKLYNHIKKDELIYINHLYEYITKDQLNDYEPHKNLNINNMRKNIDQSFYEGFGQIA